MKNGSKTKRVVFIFLLSVYFLCARWSEEAFARLAPTAEIQLG